MSNTDPLSTYKTPQFQRIKFVIVAFVVLFAVSVLSAILVGRGILPLAGIIGIAIASYFTTAQTILLYPDKLTQKGFIGKGIECPCKDGTFSLENATTSEALFVSFQTKKLVIRYKRRGAQKPITIGGTISDADLREMYQKIQEKQKTSS